jgi:FecR protein
MRTKTLSGILLLLALGLLLSSGAQADVVGRLTQVEGRVDILKGGQLPATQVKVEDGVETGDVLRTKTLSKAQITFIDNSTLTLAPESRVGIEAYMFDSAQNKRNAVVQLFQGLAHVVVNKVFKSTEPDFVVKTHTAVMGVRGTEFGIRLQPNSSTILNLEGVLQVGNIFPEVGQLSRRALKMAYSFGPPGSSNSVLLRNKQGTEVGKGMPPTLPFNITAEDWKSFTQPAIGPISRKGGGDTGGGEGGASTSTGATTSYAGFTGQQGSDTSGLNPGLSLASLFQTALSNSTVYTPPTDQQPLETPVSNHSNNSNPLPPSQTFSFRQTYSGYSLFSPGATSNTANIDGYAWGQRTGAFDSYFVAQDSGTRKLLSSSGGGYDAYMAASTSGGLSLMNGESGGGSITGTLANSSVQVSGRMMGSVTGVLGVQDLTGSMVFRGKESDGVRFTYRGDVTLKADGSMTFGYKGRWFGQDGQFGKAQGTMTFVPGTFFSQTATGTVQAILDTNTSSLVLLDKGGLEGTQKGAYPGKFKGSLAAMITSPGLGDFSSYGSGTEKLGTADITMKMQGVVAGQPGATLAGVMDVKMKVDGSALAKFAGPVSLDPATGVLSGQGNASINLGGATANLAAAWIQAPKGSGIKTDSFMVTADGGKFDQVRSDQKNVATISSTFPMTGHLKGVNAGPISTDFNLTSTITDPSVHFSRNIQGKAAATMVGVVAGTPGADKNGIAQAVINLKDKPTGTVNPQALSGTVNITPTGQMNAVLTGANPAINPASPVLVPATQTGTVTVTPKPGG